MKASIQTFVHDYAALLAAIQFNREARDRYHTLFMAAGKGMESDSRREHYQHMCEHHAAEVYRLLEWEKRFEGVMAAGIGAVWGDTTPEGPISQPRA